MLLFLLLYRLSLGCMGFSVGGNEIKLFESQRVSSHDRDQ